MRLLGIATPVWGNFLDTPDGWVAPSRITTPLSREVALKESFTKAKSLGLLGDGVRTWADIKARKAKRDG